MGTVHCLPIKGCAVWFFDEGKPVKRPALTETTKTMPRSSANGPSPEQLRLMFSYPGDIMALLAGGKILYG